jgi:hypothetical protein
VHKSKRERDSHGTPVRKRSEDKVRPGARGSQATLGKAPRQSSPERAGRMEEDVPRTKECVTCGRVASGGLVGVRKFEKPSSASRRFRQSHAQDTTFKYAPFPLPLPSWLLSCFSRGARDRWTQQAPLTLRTRANSRLAHASKTLKLPRLESGLDADAGHQA